MTAAGKQVVSRAMADRTKRRVERIIENSARLKLSPPATLGMTLPFF
jgi:hypothetical protein